jgi:RND family efflux transporter MFP subunit
MKHSRTIFFGILGTIGVATAIAYAVSREPAPAPDKASEQRPALVVTTGLAENATLPGVIEAPGVVAPWQEASVSSRSSGLPIVAIHADVGDTVTKGQLLARFDDATVQADVARAAAALEQANAHASEARINRDRALQLGESGVLSKQDTLTAMTNAAATAAEVAQAQAALKAARLALEHTRVVAPDAGVISARSVALGVVAQPGTELFRMIRQGRLEWRAELTAQQLAQVQAGVQATVRTMDGGTVKGRVRVVAPSLDASTRLGLAYVDLEPSSAVRASMYLKGQLELAEREVVTVPSASVVVRDGRTYVAALDGNRVRFVAVTTGRTIGDRTEVAGGLAAGATIVVRGAGFLSDRDVVRVAQPG